MEKEAFEPTGLIPRSIIRTVDRFVQQLLPGKEKIALQEYRVSRYQILVSIKSLALLVCLPLLSSSVAKALVFTPVIEHLWNSNQSEIFLNGYQEKRAFSEMHDFSEKMFFESLLMEPRDRRMPYVRKASLGSHIGTAKPSVQNDTFYTSQTKQGFVRLNANRKEYARTNLTGFAPCAPAMPLQSEALYAKGEKRRYRADPISSAWPYTPTYCAQPPCRGHLLTPLLAVHPMHPLHPMHPYGVQGVHGVHVQGVQGVHGVHVQGGTRGNGGTGRGMESRAGAPVVKEGPTLQGFYPLCEPQQSFYELFLTRLPTARATPTATSAHQEHDDDEKKVIQQNNCEPFYSNDFDLFFKNRSLMASLPIWDSRGVDTEQDRFTNLQDEQSYQKAFQTKSLELAKSYNRQSIVAITNLLGDFLTFFVVLLLVRSMRPQLIILKSFLTESVYSLSDTTKSFLLILGMDLLVGFHSPRGWELALEGFLRHVGLPENENFILLFVALFPVFLDTVFKYWIFRYLNKISPSTVVTYHSMIE